MLCPVFSKMHESVLFRMNACHHAGFVVGQIISMVFTVISYEVKRLFPFQWFSLFNLGSDGGLFQRVYVS